MGKGKGFVASFQLEPKNQGVGASFRLEPEKKVVVETCWL
jgi:hypothetical protein